MLFGAYLVASVNFHFDCSSQLPKIGWQTSVQTCSTSFDSPPFWIASKQIFLRYENYFCYKLIPNKTELWKNIWKKYFAFFQKNSPWFIGWS